MPDDKRHSATIYQQNAHGVLISSTDDDIDERQIESNMIGWVAQPGDSITVHQAWDSKYEEWFIRGVTLYRSCNRGGASHRRFTRRALAIRQIEQAVCHLKKSRGHLADLADLAAIPGNKTDLAAIDQSIERLLSRWRHLDRQLERDSLMPRIRSDWYQFTAAMHASRNVRHGSGEWDCDCPACSAARANNFTPLFMRAVS